MLDSSAVIRLCSGLTSAIETIFRRHFTLHRKRSGLVFKLLLYLLKRAEFYVNFSTYLDTVLHVHWLENIHQTSIILNTFLHKQKIEKKNTLEIFQKSFSNKF